MAGAPYQFDLTLSDDATPEFSVEWTLEDGTDFPWSDYEASYSVQNSGAGCFARSRGWQLPALINLSQGNGVAVDPTINQITFTLPAGRYCKGRFEHGCRVKHVASGRIIQIFDGTLTITEGGFR